MTSIFYAAEHVFPGHPDKLCDAIADALVQEAGRREHRALVGVEVAVHRDQVFVSGRIACVDARGIDIPAIVRHVYQTAGYDGDWNPRPEELRIQADLCLGPLEEGEADFRSWSDDQSIITGYAIATPGTNYLPPEHWLAWKLGRRLQKLRVELPGLELGPDGKVLVHLEQGSGSLRLSAVSVSMQQRVGGDTIQLRRAVIDAVVGELASVHKAIPDFEDTVPETVTVNGGGNFEVGGPEGDNGLSGKKLVIDAYGPRVSIGGGALSGKDFFKADRAGAIAARRLARAVVATGVSNACTATLSFEPGANAPQVVSLVGEDGNPLDARPWVELFDNSLAGMGERYTDTADLLEVARNGHFTDPNLPWETLTFDECPAKRFVTGRTLILDEHAIGEARFAQQA